jgi:hypothetical protein
VAQAVVHDFDRRSLHAEHLAHERSEAGHRPAHLAAEHRRGFCICSSEARSSMNMPRRQLPSVMTFGVSAITATLSPLTSAPSISLADVEHERTRQ